MDQLSVTIKQIDKPDIQVKPINICPQCERETDRNHCKYCEGSNE